MVLHADGPARFVTVVMPVRNEERDIAASLRSVLRQEYPQGQLEVVIADGMSDDRTRAIIGDVVRDTTAGANGPRVVVLDNPDRTAAAGLNRAIARARGDVVVRVDGHCEIDPTYVSTCVQLLDTTGADNVGGVQVPTGTSLRQRAIALGTSSPFGVGGARFHYATRAGWADTVFLGAWNRAVFDRVGLFDEELDRNQDDEHNHRIRQAGGRIWLDPALRTRYTPRSTLADLSRQYFAYGLHKVRVIQKRRAIAAARHVVPAAFVASIVLLGALGVTTRRPRLVLLVLGPWTLASVAASAVAAREDLGTFPVLPAVFATLHVSYGLGFLAGTWHWRRARTSSARAR